MKMKIDTLIRCWLSFMRGDRRAIILLFLLIVISIVAQLASEWIDVKAKYDDQRYYELLSAVIGDSSVTAKSNLNHLPDTIGLNRSDFTGLFNTPVTEISDLNSSTADIEVERSDQTRFFGGAEVGISDSNFQSKRADGSKSNFIGSTGGGLGISDQNRSSLYQLLSDTLKNFKKRKMSASFSEKSRERVELNSADSAKLTSLYGIGPVFAVRIIKYRSLLKGFSSVEQLMEVYGFTEERYCDLLNQIYVDTTKIEKININFAGFSKLIRHPYFDSEVVKAVINSRDRQGYFTSAEELLSRGVVDSVKLVKLKPYIICR